MTDRASNTTNAFRGRGGNSARGSGTNRGSGRGGHHQHQHQHHPNQQQHQSQGSTEKSKKENILDLGKYMDKSIRVKFNGGREVVGILKGYDQLMNLVLDDVREVMRDDEGNESARQLGLVVARGTLLVLIAPTDGAEEIANPFVQEE